MNASDGSREGSRGISSRHSPGAIGSSCWRRCSCPSWPFCPSSSWSTGRRVGSLLVRRDLPDLEAWPPCPRTPVYCVPHTARRRGCLRTASTRVGACTVAPLHRCTVAPLHRCTVAAMQRCSDADGRRSGALFCSRSDGRARRPRQWWLHPRTTCCRGRLCMLWSRGRRTPCLLKLHTPCNNTSGAHSPWSVKPAPKADPSQQ